LATLFCLIASTGFTLLFTANLIEKQNNKKLKNFQHFWKNCKNLHLNSTKDIEKASSLAICLFLAF